MNSHQQSDNNEYHDALLREWVVDAPLPPRFLAGVWQRIARAEAAPRFSLGVGLIRFLEAALPRPRIAFSYIAILIVLGVAAGLVTAHLRNGHLNAALSARYVQSVDPYGAETWQP